MDQVASKKKNVCNAIDRWFLPAGGVYYVMIESRRIFQQERWVLVVWGWGFTWRWWIRSGRVGRSCDVGGREGVGGARPENLGQLPAQLQGATCTDHRLQLIPAGFFISQSLGWRSDLGGHCSRSSRSLNVQGI